MGVRKDSLLGCSVFVLGAGCTQPQCPYKKWDMTRQDPQDWCLLHLYTLDKILRQLEYGSSQDWCLLHLYTRDKILHQLEYGFMLIVTIVHDLSCPPGTEPRSGFRLGSLVLICFFRVFQVRNREEERAKNMAILMGMSLAPSSWGWSLPRHMNKDAELLKQVFIGKMIPIWCNLGNGWDQDFSSHILDV